MKKMQTKRSGVRQGGFTLIELMMVVALLTILAAIAFTGIRQNEFGGQYRNFLDDLHGALVTAQNEAIDEQTQVRVTVESEGLTVRAYDPATTTWNVVARARINSATSSLLLDGNACVLGVTAGVQTPAQADGNAALQPPSGCLSGEQTFLFEADGRFTDSAGLLTIANTGMTLWASDRRQTDRPVLSAIQIFPGGLIRVFERVE